MPEVLQEDETLSASVVVRATPEQVYEVVSDVTRIPEWSPETIRCVSREDGWFTSWNRRRLGVWRTSAQVRMADPGREFAFVVQVMGQDWTEWTYRMEPGPGPDSGPGTTVLTEEFRMCMKLPLGAVVFERLFLFVRDRREDLRRNLQTSVTRIREIVERSGAQSQ